MSEDINHKFKSSDIYQTKAGTNAQYFSNQPQKHPRKTITDKQLKLLRHILTVAIIILIPAVAAFAIYVITHPSGDSGTTSDTSTQAELGKGLPLDTAPDSVADSDSINAKAAAALANSGLQAFLNEYQDSIETANTDSEKSALYLDRALDLFSYYSQTEDNDFLSQALNDALEAERLAPTAATASTLANIYEHMDDSSSVAKYQSLVRDRAPETFKDLME